MRYFGVKKWTKQTDIFEKDLLLFPINKNAHWYLIAVVSPQLMHLEDEERKPLIVVLDSLETYNSDIESAVMKIKSYLIDEFLGKKGVLISNEVDLDFLLPSCPQQPDGSSCGVFLLYFASKLLSSKLDHYLLKENYDLSDWKKLDDILDGRRKLSEVILELSIEQGHRRKLDIP